MVWELDRFNTIPRAKIDYATPVGIAAAFGLMLFSISLGSGLSLFIDLNSLLIVLGGTIGATLIGFPLEDFARSFSVLRTAFYEEQTSRVIRLRRLVDLARQARSVGKLAFESKIPNEPDPFLRKGLELVVDGLDSPSVRTIMAFELSALEDRHRRGAQLFQMMGTISPAMGLIGTVIGLVEMLQNLHDPAEIGPAMSTALLTTFYGTVLAYVVFLPLAGKLRARSRDEKLLKEMTIEGLCCIADGTNPRIIEQNLLGFLPPEQRVSQYD